MTHLEKLDLVQWVLDELDQAYEKNLIYLTEMEPEDIQRARDFIKDIREDYIDDFK